MSLFSPQRRLGDSGFLDGATDWHSHILPGVDDGFKTMEDSLEALAFYESLGIKHLWLTPHIMEDMPNETADLRERFAELKEKYSGKMRLSLAAENMLDPLFETRLANNDFLPIGEAGNHLLVETSYFSAPSNFSELLSEVNAKGYFVLLAHPERYVYMDKEDYQELRESGVKFQINYGSLVGAYGNTARKKAEWLLKERMVDVYGSDVHRLRSVKGQLDGKASSKAIKSIISLPAVEI